MTDALPAGLALAGAFLLVGVGYLLGLADGVRRERARLRRILGPWDHSA